MVLIIVSRNIDLSVGSIVGVVAMVYALLQTDWLPGAGPGARQPVPVARRAGPWARARGVHRRRPGLHHRLHRRPVLHRHAGRPALAPRDRSGSSPAAPRSPVSTATSGCIGGGAGRLDRRHWLTWALGIIGCLAIIGLLVQQPPPAASVRLPAAADVGGGPPRRRRLRASSSASSPSPTPTSGRRASPASTRPRTASPSRLAA